MSPEGKYELQEEMVSKGKGKLTNEYKSVLTVNQRVYFVGFKGIHIELKSWKSAR